MGGPVGEGGDMGTERERERDHLVPNCMPIGDCHGLLMSSLSFVTSLALKSTLILDFKFTFFYFESDFKI